MRRIEWLGWIAMGLLPASIAAAAPTAQSEYRAVLAAKPDTVRGEELYRTCAACHGADGSGVSDGTVPAIGGQHFRVIAKQLVDFRHDRRWDIRMEHFADRHHLPGPQELADLATYVSGLQRVDPPGIGPGEHVARGARIYFAECASCHGATGKGNEQKLVPALAGQQYDYLVRQFYDAPEGRRPNMTADHARLLAKFDRDDIQGVADYLSRLSFAPVRGGMTRTGSSESR